MPEQRQAADSRAWAVHDWLHQRQHTEAWCWPGGSYIWPISSQPLQWLSTPLRACWNNIIRTRKCWRPPCPLPAQNSVPRNPSESDLSARRSGPFLNRITCKTTRTLQCCSSVSLAQYGWMNGWNGLWINILLHHWKIYNIWFWTIGELWMDYKTNQFS